MGKNKSSMLVLRIRPKFWWMLPMGVRDKHTKYELDVQPWRPRTGITLAGLLFQNLQSRAKMSLFFFLRKSALDRAKNGQMKGHCCYSANAPRLPRAEGPSKALQLHNVSTNRPLKWCKKAHEFVHIGQQKPPTKDIIYLGVSGPKPDQRT